MVLAHFAATRNGQQYHIRCFDYMSVHDECYFRNVRTVLYIYVFLNTTRIVKTARKNI